MASKNYGDSIFLMQVEQFKQSFKNNAFNYENVGDLKESFDVFFDEKFYEYDDKTVANILTSTFAALCKHENLPIGRLTFLVNERNHGSALFDLIRISKLTESKTKTYVGEHYLITLLHEFRHYKWHYVSKQYFNQEAKDLTNYETFMAIYNVVNYALLASGLHTNAVLGFNTAPYLFTSFNECELDAEYYSTLAYKNICAKLNKTPKEELVKDFQFVTQVLPFKNFEKENLTSKQSLADFTFKVIKAELTFFQKHFKNNASLQGAITDLKNFDYKEYKTLVTSRMKNFEALETKTL